MNNSQVERWTSDIENWDELTPDISQLYLSYAEDRLKGTMDADEAIERSNDRFIGFTITLLSISLGYIFTGPNGYLVYVSIFVAIICIIAGFQLILNLRSRLVYTLGEEPKRVFNSNFFNDMYTNEQKYCNLVFQLMEMMQWKIDNNRLLNQSRLAKLEKAKRILLIVPLSFIIAAFLYHYFPSWVHR